METQFIQGPVSWRPTAVKWRQFSQSNCHSTIGTRQTEYHEALPSSVNDEVRCDCTFADDGSASWYVWRWWNDGWTVKTVVTWRSSASMIPAPDHGVQSIPNCIPYSYTKEPARHVNEVIFVSRGTLEYCLVGASWCHGPVQNRTENVSRGGVCVCVCARARVRMCFCVQVKYRDKSFLARLGVGTLK